MAVASDSAVTGGRGHASGNLIAIAGDRTATRARARRHSRRVRVMKIALPATAIVSLGVCAFGILKGMSLSSAISAIPVPQIVADNLKMQNPHYEGFNADGGRYWVRAKTAQQDLKAIGIIRLDGITGELTDVKKQKTNLVATRGAYDQKSGLLELYDSIHVTGDSGMTADLTRASIKTKENIITSDQPSKVTMPTGQITSNQLTVRSKTKEYTFVDDVRTHLTPKAPAAGDVQKSAATPLPFGKPGEPIDVTSNRLDIDDLKKTAIFTGTVVAKQAGATMTAPDMTVTYEGAVAPGSDDAKTASTDAAGSGTKVKQILVNESVMLQQASGETATSHSAVFDAEAKTAVLEGDVVLTQGSDKRATGDRADYDETAQTMILTGPVVVTQGANILKGRKLVYERTTSKMHLTSPIGSAAGRVSAHFVRPNAKAPTTADDETQTSDGIAFGSGFKTDPTAPYDVLADRLDVDDVKKAAVFTGNVVAVQGESTMKAAEMTALYTGSAALSTPDGGAAGGAASLKHITARRQVSITSKDGQTATGDWAEVDTKSNLATLGGAVKLVQGSNVVKGTKVVINLTTGEATVKTEPTSPDAGAMISSSDGNGAGQIIKADRPSAIFYPGQMSKKKPKVTADDVNIGGWQARTSP